MGKYQANLPAVWNPVGDTCVRVYVPNHPDYIKLFVRAIRMLEVNRMYERDETGEGAKIVTAQWRDRTVTPLIEYLANSTGDCGDLDGECITYPPFANFISYYPQNPYTEPDLIPDGFEQPPFFVNGKDNAHNLPNYNKGDVLIDFGSVNLEPSWDLAKTPRIELCLEGSGVVELHLLNIAQGGMAIISVDNPVDLGDIIAGVIGDSIDIIDLNQDIVSLPPETAEEIIIEREIALDGEHTVYVYFFPVVNDSLIPLGFGGGLREISLCGNLRPCGTPPEPPPPPLDGVTELKPQFQFTPDCGLEYRLLDQEDNIVQDWTPVEGWTENAALCFAVGGGGMATKEDIKQALIEWTQWGAGAILGYEVDEEGNPIIPPDEGGGEPLPEDDPATEINETESAIYGAMLEIALRLEQVLDKIDTLYGAVNGTPVTAEQDAQSIMVAYFSCDQTLMQTAVTSYYGWRVSNNQFGFQGSTTFPLYLYCNGYDMNDLNRYLLDVAAYTINKVNRIGQFWEALSDSFFTESYAKGQSKPSTAYLDASCVPMPYQEFLNIPYNSSRNLSPATAKGGHRLLIEVSGYFVDGSEIQDAFWYRNASGVLVRSNFQFVHAAGSNMPSDNQVPYSTTHAYSYTIDLSTGTSSWSVNFPRNANMDVASTSPTNGFSIKITDLGQVSL